MSHAEKCPIFIRLKAKLGLPLKHEERGKYCRWITRNVKTPEGLNAHDVCEMEWENDGSKWEVVE
jgi:hypothetical protein